MLSLDDPRWGQLQHAYGPGDTIPALLRQLAASTAPKKSYSDEPWFTLWSSLYHQDYVYSASYAAVPHIVEIAAKAEWPIDSSFFALPVAVEVARANSRDHELPDDLAEAYYKAIERLGDLTCQHMRQPWDRDMLRSAIAAQAAAKDQIDIAEALLNLDDDWIGRIVNDAR